MGTDPGQLSVPEKAVPGTADPGNLENRGRVVIKEGVLHDQLGWEVQSPGSPRNRNTLLHPLHTPLSAFILCLVLASAADGAEPIQLGSRRELFVDNALTERLDGKLTLQLHHPMPREVALKFDQPWEGNASGYPTVIQDGELYRMYYRGHRYIIDPPPLRQAQPEVVCYAESRDGIHWDKPHLRLRDWPGSKDNNIIWRDGYETHNFAPFKDSNPHCKPDERFKAVGGTIASKGLLTFKSADGIRWSKLSDGPVVTTGGL